MAESPAGSKREGVSWKPGGEGQPPGRSPWKHPVEVGHQLMTSLPGQGFTDWKWVFVSISDVLSNFHKRGNETEMLNHCSTGCDRCFDFCQFLQEEEKFQH